MGLPIIRDGKPAGIVWAGIDNEDLAKSTTSQIDFGARGGIYAYDTKGTVMLHRDPKAFGRDDSKKPYLADVLTKPEGMVRFVGEDGRNKTIFTGPCQKLAGCSALKLTATKYTRPRG